MAAPRPKKKKAVVKKKTDVKSPAETRKSISRKQVGTTRPARGDLGARAQYLKYGPTQPQGPEAPRYREKIGPVKPTASAGSKALALLGKVAKVSGIVGAITSPITSAVPAGTGSTVPGQAQKAVEKKMKREIRQGSKLAVTGVKEGTTRRLAPTGSRKPAPGTNYSGQEKKIPRKPAPGTNYSGPKASGNKSGVGGPGGARALGSSSTAATTAAASGSNGGGSQAANVAKAGGKAKAKVGRQTRYQRESLAMEQRKRSSSKPKKSIFSLFRKG